MSNLRRTGFTLLELILSSSVAAGVLAAAYMCLQGALSSQKSADDRMELAQTARVVLRMITADLRSACRLDKEAEFVGLDRKMSDGSGEVDADNLDFATHNWSPRAPGEGDFCEVSWYVDKSRETGELCLYRRRDSSPDDQPLDGGTREEIASGVAGLRFEYSDGFIWYDAWGEMALEGQPRAAFGSFNDSGLPEAVRITLSLREGDSEAPAPGAPRRQSRLAPGEKPPPAIAFQTVVRLNLAGRESDSALGGSSAGDYGSAGNSTPAGEGGRQ